MSRCGEALLRYGSLLVVRVVSSLGSEQVIMATNRIESLDPALSECALSAFFPLYRRLCLLRCVV